MYSFRKNLELSGLFTVSVMLAGCGPEGASNGDIGQTMSQPPGAEKSSGQARFESILPDNDLHLHPPHSTSGIDERTFNGIIDAVAVLYQPIVRAHGANLQFGRNWTSNVVNAYAARSGINWQVEMYGGLARRPEVTADGFALVVCHEVGHHLGGFPFKGDSWAGAEGQADYFATQACARKLWRDDLGENQRYRMLVPASVVSRCDTYWNGAEDRDLCYRTAAAGKSLADLLAVLEAGSVHFDTPDPTRVTATNIDHPAAQCRLDTYIAGGLCNISFNDAVIPGLNVPLGRNGLYAEMEASLYSCLPVSVVLGVPGANDAYRSRCWFKPQFTDGTTLF